MRRVRPMVGPVGLAALVSSVVLATCASTAGGPAPTASTPPPLAPAATGPTPGQTGATVPSGDGVEAAGPAPPGADPDRWPGSSGSAVVAAPPGAPIAGTDAVAPAPVSPEPALVEALYRFGRLYLGYDHADDARAVRIEALRPLVTPALLAALAQPLPPALVQSLAAERRTVEAEPVGIESLDATTYLLSFLVATTVLDTAPGSAAPSASGPPVGPTVTTEELRTLVVTLDADGRVGDVR